MIKEIMTVHQALCELKVLNKRILSAISAVKPVATKEHSSSNVDGEPVEKFIEYAKSTHASAIDLIMRQIAIKAAINQYNASRIITVAGKQYSVAQAIWMMNYGIQHQQELLNMYSVMLKRASAEIERKNGDDLNTRAEAAMNAVYDSKDKANHKAYLEGVEEYKKSHTLEIVDPLGIRDIIAKMESEIASFQSGVDAAIQVANATTEIEIEY